MIHVRLRSLDPSYSDVDFELHDDPLILGRSASADVQIAHPHVSRYHCKLESRNGELSIRDLHSTNGIFVNGNSVTEAELRSGDRLMIGGFDLRVFVMKTEDTGSSVHAASQLARPTNL